MSQHQDGTHLNRGGMSYQHPNAGRGKGRGAPNPAGAPMRRPSQEQGGVPYAQGAPQFRPGQPNVFVQRTSSAPPDMKEQHNAPQGFIPQKGYQQNPQNPQQGMPQQQNWQQPFNPAMQNWTQQQYQQMQAQMYNQMMAQGGPHMGQQHPPMAMGGPGPNNNQRPNVAGSPNVSGRNGSAPLIQLAKKRTGIKIVDPNTKEEVKVEKEEKKATPTSSGDLKPATETVAPAEAVKEKEVSKPTPTKGGAIKLTTPDGADVDIPPRKSSHVSGELNAAAKTEEGDDDWEKVGKEDGTDTSKDAAAPASTDKTDKAPAAGDAAKAAGDDAKKDDAGKKDDKPAAPAAAVEPPSYPEGTWSPDNPKGKMMYSRDFLLKFKALCTQAPEGLPPIEVIVGAEPAEGDNQNNRQGHGRQSFHGNRSSNNYGGNHRDSHRQHGGRHNRDSRDNFQSGGRHDRRDGRQGKGRGRKPQPGGPTIPLDQVRPLEMSETRWKPQRQGGGVADKTDKLADIDRKTKALLNKLTVEKFEQISDQILDVGITSALILETVISLIFNKALDEPNFSQLYAELCVKLAEQLPEFKNPEDMDSKGRPQTFKRILLNQCQKEFTNVKPVKEELTDEMKEGKSEAEIAEMEEEIEYRFMLARKRNLGNVKFIGELYRHRMLTEKIMNECIKQLLGDITVDVLDEDNLEAMCQLLTTIGKVLDNSEKSKASMRSYFQSMATLAQDAARLPSRIRFMIKDVIDLRARNWVPRRKVEKAKNLEEIRAEAIRAQQERDGHRGNFRHNSRGGGRDDRGGSGDYRNRGQSGPMHSMPPMARGGRNQGGNSAKGEWEVASSSRHTSRDSLRDRDQRPTRHTSTEEVNQPVGFRPGGGLGAGAKGWSRDSGNDQGSGGSNPFALLSRQEQSSGGSGGTRHMSLDQVQTKKDERSNKKAQSASTSRDNADPPKKPSFSPEELRKKADGTIKEYFSIQDKTEAALCVKEFESPDFHPDFVDICLTEIMEAKQEQCNLMGDLLVHLHAEDILSTDDLINGFDKSLEILPDVAIDAPKAQSYVCQVLAKLIVANAMSCSYLTSRAVANMYELGGYPPDFAAITIHAIRDSVDDEAALIALWNKARPDLSVIFPSDQRSVSDLVDFAKRKDISFLFPELEAISSIKEMVENDKTSEDIIEFITSKQDTFTEDVITSDAFASKLTTIVIEKVANETVFKDTTRSEPNQATDSLKAEERELISKYTTLLRRVLTPNLQCTALFAVQAFCYEANWPVGLMERVFHHLYDLDVVFEEAFTQWKEDETAEQPGKVNALFQVNRFLQWLDEAEEESDDEDDEDDS